MTESDVLDVYGLKVSYFSGKLESFLRYKGIPYRFHAMTAKQFMHTIPEATGAMQMPAVQLNDGRWLTDTTPIIEWLDERYPKHTIYPSDPVQKFIGCLIEDYADEWLWRPAMHFRWSYPLSAKLLVQQITDDMGRDIPAPGWLKRWRTRRRQFQNFVKNDGVNATSRAHVEGSYLRLLQALRTALSNKPFLLGQRPTIADIGLMGPCLRHFSMDPTPGAIMREEYPDVMAWVYRVWASHADSCEGPLDSGVPVDLDPLLIEIAETHIPALIANAQAWQQDQELHNFTVQDTSYQNIRTSPYRVWCLERLQERLNELDDGDRKRLDQRLNSIPIVSGLEHLGSVQSGYDPEHRAPFIPKSWPVFNKIRG